MPKSSTERSREFREKLKKKKLVNPAEKVAKKRKNSEKTSSATAKSPAQYMREYRARKKTLQNTLLAPSLTTNTVDVNVSETPLVTAQINRDFEDNPVPSTSSKPVEPPHPYGIGRPRKNPLNIDLQMECCDDFLSPIQAEFLLKAEMQYNMVMKNLRELMACNVKVTQTDVNGVPIASPSVHLKSGNVTVNTKSPAIKQMNTGSAMVVPMTLIQSPIVIT